MNDSGSAVSRPSSFPSWLLPLLILVVVILGYGISPCRLPLWGEETCRARHGIEMAQSGDWLVATFQSVPMLDRPPLQYWVFALIHKYIHALDPLTIRLFMVVVTLGTSLLIWWYSRRFFSEAGAFLAAVAYPTMGHIFDLGRRAETDALFTLLLVGALMLWHYGYSQRWRPLWTWTAGAIVAALATLAKGAQGPVAFFGAVYLFLLIRRDWRYLLNWSNLVGVVLFLLLIAAWQVPFYLKTGWEGTQLTWLEPYVTRLSTDIPRLLRHLAEFPFEVLGATLPWSVLLVGLFHPRFWQLGEKARSAVVFMLLGMAMIFVPVWISVGGKARFVMPMYPLMAVLCGAVVQQCLSADMKSILRRFWRDYLRVMAVIIAVFVAVFFAATVAAGFSDGYWISTLAQPWSLMIILVCCAAAGAVLIFRQASSGRREHALMVTFTLAALLAICFNGAVLNVKASIYANVGPEVIALRHRLPAEARLVSLGELHHQFVYWYEEHIPMIQRPTIPDEVPADLEYFAMDARRGEPVELPFDWEQIATLNMDRIHKADPKVFVLVGRRIRDSKDYRRSLGRDMNSP